MTIKPYKLKNLSAIKSINHGYFSRNGGVSKGIYESLNCGLGSDDDIKFVLENRKRVAEYFISPSATSSTSASFSTSATSSTSASFSLSTTSTPLISLYQIHSNKVLEVNADFLTSYQKGVHFQADGLVCKKKNIIISAMSADCVPILFADEKNQIIGSAHSGWKGAYIGISEAVIEKMCLIGAEISQITVGIGPCISAEAYEVGVEFYDKFISQCQDNAAFFAKSDGAENKYLFDIISYILSRLKKYPLKSIATLGKCTYKNPDQFFSYRRSCHKGEPDYGRLISGIMLK